MRLKHQTDGSSSVKKSRHSTNRKEPTAATNGHHQSNGVKKMMNGDHRRVDDVGLQHDVNTLLQTVVDRGVGPISRDGTGLPSIADTIIRPQLPKNRKKQINGHASRTKSESEVKKIPAKHSAEELALAVLGPRSDHVSNDDVKLRNKKQRRNNSKQRRRHHSNGHLLQANQTSGSSGSGGSSLDTVHLERAGRGGRWDGALAPTPLAWTKPGARPPLWGSQRDLLMSRGSVEMFEFREPREQRVMRVYNAQEISRRSSYPMDAERLTTADFLSHEVRPLLKGANLMAAAAKPPPAHRDKKMEVVRRKSTKGKTRKSAKEGEVVVESGDPGRGVREVREGGRGSKQTAAAPGRSDTRLSEVTQLKPTTWPPRSLPDEWFLAPRVPQTERSDTHSGSGGTLSSEPDNRLPRIVLISSRVPKSTLLHKTIRQDVNIMDVVYNFEEAKPLEILDAVKSNLQVFGVEAKAKSLLLYCTGGAGFIYFLKNFTLTPQKLRREQRDSDLAKFWRGVARILTPDTPSDKSWSHSERPTVHIMGCNVLTTSQGLALFEELENASLPYSVQFHQVQELFKEGKSVIRKYFDAEKYRVWSLHGGTDMDLLSDKLDTLDIEGVLISDRHS